MVKLLGPKVSPKKSRFELVAKLYFIELDQGAGIATAVEVAEPVDSAVVLATAGLVPDQPDP